MTTTGLFVAHDFSSGGGGVDYRAVFGRRKDYIAAGLIYTVQFRADMTNWTNSGATPTLPTGAVGLNLNEIEAVSVTYPLFIDDGMGGFVNPTFFRVGVSN